MVVCSEYKSHIGKGVYEELMMSLINNIPSYVLRNNKFYEVEKVIINDSNDWKINYGLVIIK